MIRSPSVSMLMTALRLPTNDPRACAIAWRQLVDLLAQGGDTVPPRLQRVAFARVAALRPRVPVATRTAVAAALGAQPSDDALIGAMTGEEAPVLRAYFTRAHHEDAALMAALPSLGVVGRGVLRNRRDLGPDVVRALAALGPADLTLTGEIAAPPVAPAIAPQTAAPSPAAPVAIAPAVPTPAAEPSQISELVARIEEFRQRLPMTPPRDTTERFSFETRADGIIDWIDGVDRTAFIGVSIGEEAAPHAPGVDGQAAGAFRRRSPFRDARLVIGGAGAGAGDWRISANPIFDPRSGRFAGFHGDGRRPRPDEDAQADTGMSPDALRQIVHELRTPLNAIQGFAEMIETQLLGPATSAYRDRARAVLADARRLMQVVDDLDTAARIDGGRLDPTRNGPVALDAVTARVAHDLQSLARARGVALAVTRAPGAASPVPGLMLDRMVRRLTSAALGIANPGETIALDAAATHGAMTVTVTRPDVLRGVPDAQWLDPGFGPDGEWPDAPLLGLGFTVRLVDRLARECGARLQLGADAFVLTLPAAARDGTGTA